MKFGFGFKIGLAISILAVGSTSASLVFFYANTKAMVLEQMGSRLKDIGRTSVHFFSKNETNAIIALKDKIEKLALPTELVTDDIMPGDYRKSLTDEAANELMKQEDFQTLVKILRDIKAATKETSVNSPNKSEPTLAYATIMSTIASGRDRKILRFIADADYDDSELPNPIGNLLYNNSEAIRKAFSGQVEADADFRYEDTQSLLSAGIPILSDDGQVIAILALDYNAQSEVNQVKKLRDLCIAIVLASFLLSLLVAYLLARLLSRPIRQLREGADRVAARDFNTKIEINSKDELGRLSNAFNLMVAEIKDYSLGLEEHNKAYSKFVPKEFLKQLGQDSILQVKLGDQVQKQMTILFSDIRSFTSISESMSPRDNFDFINEFLGAVSPIIRAHGGFVDKFIGDAVMGLFPDGAESAVKAALEMQKSLIEFNRISKDIGRPSIQIGIGLHHGNLMLGTVGENLRMEGTVISDAVNLSSRIEGLTKDYGADIIISEKVFNAIVNRSICQIRSLGSVQVKGKKNSVNIFEIFDSNDEDLARRKVVTREDFELGIDAFEKQRYETALMSFKKVLVVGRNDLAARYFIERCEKAIRMLRPKRRKLGGLYSISGKRIRGGLGRKER